MLPSIVLFLALLTLSFTLAKLAMVIFAAIHTNRLHLEGVFVFSVITCALFSYFYYLTH